jgi:hypothetical protein
LLASTIPRFGNGLRKAGAAIAAENGVTASQLMAIFGWKIIAEAERYTKAADRKRMTQENMHFLPSVFKLQKPYSRSKVTVLKTLDMGEW